MPQKSNIKNKVKIRLECEQTSQTANYKNISSLHLVTYFTKVFCNLRLMGEKQVSTAERETRNSQVHASKNFLGLYSRSEIHFGIFNTWDPQILCDHQSPNFQQKDLLFWPTKNWGSPMTILHLKILLE